MTEPRDEGQTMLLLLFYALIVLAVIGTSVSASAVHLARHRLLSVADAAAIEAASALDHRAYYGQGAADASAGAAPTSRATVTVTSESVRASVADHVARSPAAAALGVVEIGQPTGSPDGLTAEVTLVAVVRVPLLTVVSPDHQAGIRIQVTSRARAEAA